MLFLTLLLIVAVAPQANALREEGHITLLTVAESADPEQEDVGGTADLYLSIRPGNGQIFIDSFPLTKLDTQASTRYANRVACAFLDEDCARFDFFYTIRAGSSVVGGPSAGAAIAVLTASMLEGTEIDEGIAITGTINSGGLVGPVAGIKEKATAAGDAGIELILISGFAYPTELNESYLALLNATLDGSLNGTGVGGLNGTVNLSRLYVPLNLSGLPVEVREVASIEEALAIFSGEEPPEAIADPLGEPESYTGIMREVADDLCQRRDLLVDEVAPPANWSGPNASLRQQAARSEGDWYSLASYCFGEAIRLRRMAFANLTEAELLTIRNGILERAAELQEQVRGRELETLAQLETYLIVEERIGEAMQAVIPDEDGGGTAADGVVGNATDSAAIAFAYERLNSAEVWSAFFAMESPAITLDRRHLEDACTAKVAEAQERISYVELYLPAEYLEEAQAELSLARQDERQGRSSLCLFRASKAQALADLLSGSIAVPKKRVEELATKKLDAVEGILREQESRGFFPLLGYSYYRYARSLAAHDVYSSLTFGEYALELSNLAMYFPRERGWRPAIRTDVALLVLSVFCSGALLGAAATLVIVKRLRKGKGSARRRR